jgi:hypothetical protein
MNPERAEKSEAETTLPEPHDALEAAVEQAVAACDGDERATIRALVVANSYLAEQNSALSQELDYAWRWISPGFTRSTRKRRMKSGEPE